MNHATKWVLLQKNTEIRNLLFGNLPSRVNEERVERERELVPSRDEAAGAAI
jgi:hypothetical protein